MEESKDSVLYEDYKFLTANDLQQLNATHLVGTPMLKAYMHGYFIEMRAYQKLLSVADPFAFERYRKEQITSKLNSMREKRIQVTSANTNLPKVNKDLIKDLLEGQTTTKKGVSKTGEQQAEKLMKDNRFGQLFTDKEFQIDRASEAYKLIKPVSIILPLIYILQHGDTNKRLKDEDVDSVEDADDLPKSRDINKLFEGKGAEESDNNDANEGQSDDEEDFQSKMTKQQRKTHKKQKSKDRILFTSKPNTAALRHLGEQNSASDKSKPIKKSSGGYHQKHVITDKSVKQKARSHRLVVPTYKLK